MSSGDIPMGPMVPPGPYLWASTLGHGLMYCYFGHTRCYSAEGVRMTRVVGFHNSTIVIYVSSFAPRMN